MLDDGRQGVHEVHRFLLEEHVRVVVMPRSWGWSGSGRGGGKQPVEHVGKFFLLKELDLD